MSGPSAPTLPIKGRSNVTGAGAAAAAASGARAAATTPGTTGGVRSPKKSGANKQRDGSARHKAWADFTPTPWDYVSTPWGPPGPAGLGAIPPYESVFSGAAAGGSSAKKKDGNFPSTPTPKSWGATPTPSGAQPTTNFGLGLTAAPPPLLGPTGLPLLPPGFAAMQAQMAAAAAAGAAAGAAAAASMSRDASPVDLMAAAALDLFKNYREDEDVAAARREPYPMDSMFDSSPWGLQPNMPLPVGEGNKKRGTKSGSHRGGKGSGPASKAPAPPPPEQPQHHNIPPRRPSPLVPDQPPALIPEKDLPSKGSAIHGSGKCRPCAWFWKADGCHSAQDCNYCHLCPEGELKQRKKLKVAAMRMGALTPAKPGNPPGAARTLKLTSLV